MTRHVARSHHFSLVATLVGGLISLSCASQQDSDPDTAHDSATHAVVPARAEPVVHAPVTSSPEILPAKAAAPHRSKTSDTTKAASAGAATPIPASASTKGRETTIAELVKSDSLVGQVVRVAGQCFLDTPALAPGGVPRTRSDWQLAMNRQAVFVTGPRPAACGENAPVQTITARVAQDTMRVAGREIARRYLARVSP